MHAVNHLQSFHSHCHYIQTSQLWHAIWHLRLVYHNRRLPFGPRTTVGGDLSLDLLSETLHLRVKSLSDEITFLPFVVQDVPKCAVQMSLSHTYPHASVAVLVMTISIFASLPHSRLRLFLSQPPNINIALLSAFPLVFCFPESVSTV